MRRNLFGTWYIVKISNAEEKRDLINQDEDGGGGVRNTQKFYTRISCGLNNTICFSDPNFCNLFASVHCSTHRRSKKGFLTRHGQGKTFKPILRGSLFDYAGPLCSNRYFKPYLQGCTGSDEQCHHINSTFEFYCVTYLCHGHRKPSVVTIEKCMDTEGICHDAGATFSRTIEGIRYESCTCDITETQGFFERKYSCTNTYTTVFHKGKKTIS
ncbi:hypothetical protein PoB_001698000 [Plakobranchus ocellatus]|uniref:Lipocalin/cytosolic fatty-acid binding domain-containing protein n=1 Tax=Plakobranchus ocellatus TaxID=259542 RepID=A0AAV3Z7E1_9GAST|nr:hypothetical protein PoB_001698000 [Plakobranchus ocellatus]